MRRIVTGFTPIAGPTQRLRTLLGSVPYEQPGGAGLGGVVRTLGATLRGTRELFVSCPEPVAHAKVMAYWAWLRIPLWLGAAGMLATETFILDPRPTGLMPVHSLLEVAMTQVITIWSVLLVPVGLPLLYLTLGIAAHIGIGLTGGAPRSVGVSMRAIGYAAGWSLLVAGAVDLAFALTVMPWTVWAGASGVGVLWLWYAGGRALADAHGIRKVRAWAVMIGPVLIWSALALGRGLLQLRELPGLAAPHGGGYFVP